MLVLSAAVRISETQNHDLVKRALRTLLDRNLSCFKSTLADSHPDRPYVWLALYSYA